MILNFKNSSQIDLLTQETNQVSLIFLRNQKKKFCVHSIEVIVFFYDKHKTFISLR